MYFILLKCNFVCILITFNNPIKVCFSKKKYPIKNPNTPYSIFLIIKKILSQNQLPITFCTDLVCNRTLKARNSTPT